jgi:uncharacterized protein YfdQ (DUF2303 family)
MEVKDDMHGVLEAVYEKGRDGKIYDTADGGKAIVIPEGYEVHEFGPLDRPLTHIKQSLLVHDIESFIDYVNLHKAADGSSRIFAEPGFLAPGGVAGIIGILDYHNPDKTGRLAHSVTYRPRYSEQWLRWKQAFTKPMTQIEFAEFTEEVHRDLVVPEGLKLLDIVRTFKGQKEVNFDSLTYQPDSSVVINYTEKVTQTGKMGAIPEKLMLGIPVYFNGEGLQCPVFLRFHLSGGKLTFMLKADRWDIVEQAAFDTLIATVTDATGIKPYLGKP